MPETLITPLGGLNEIGLNCLAIETADGMVLVDCGLLAGAPGFPGVDYIIPDFAYLRERQHKLLGVLLTHGHDDHVGAVPHLLQEFPVPVFGTPYTLELLDARMKDVAPSQRHLLRRIDPGIPEAVGPFQFELLRVPHSVPDACAVALRTPGGSVLCSGDFKLDPSPLDGRPIDEAGFARWKGVDLLCCDSTNAARPGSTPSEREVGAALRRLFPAVAGRVYFTTFSSHIHRIQQVVEVSRESGRSVTLLGRSLVENVRAARRLGRLHAAPGDIIPEQRAATMPRERITVVLAGAQGEAGSALRRVVEGGVARHRLLPGDEVFLSARAIPGYERTIGALIDRCLEQGARVHAGEAAGVHVSGHPSASDVLGMLDLASPSHILPIHGERRHREALSALARRWGLPEGSVLQADNGQSVVLADGRVRQGPRACAGRVFVEQGRLGAEGDLLLRDRARLGRGGVALVTAAVGSDGTLVSGPRVALRGVFPAAFAGQATREAEHALQSHLSSLGLQGGGPREIEVEIKTALRRHLRKHLAGPPLVVVQVAEVDSENGAPLQ